MNDATGLMYDDEAAVFFVGTATGLDESKVRAILRSRDRYHLGFGILPAEAAQEGETPEAIRAQHPALFRPDDMARRFVNESNERAYVVSGSGASVADVTAILGADQEYMQKQGIRD